MVWCKSIPYVGNKDAKVLILGSMPGAVSLQYQQYYAHPRNHFWPIIYSILGQPLPTDYLHRIQGLRDNGIALWDVIAECAREGSSDASISMVKPNNFRHFFTEHPDIKLVAFNGAKAAEVWRKYVSLDLSNFLYVVLPSTSPALTRPLSEKLQAWEMINQYL